MTAIRFARYPDPAFHGLSRRGILAGAACLTLAGLRAPAADAATPIPGTPASGRLAFDVFRKDSRIGTHILTFQSAGAALTVHIAADFKVGLGPIALFRYSLRTTEHWQDGKLASATSQADNNGTRESMTAQRQGNALVVQGSKSGRYTAPQGAILATHWNRAELNGPMVNPENGTLMRFAIADRGTGTIAAAGRTIPATQYALTGPATLTLWYDDQSVWSALRAVATDGSVIDYRLT